MQQHRLTSGTGLALAAVLAVASIILVNNTFTSFRLDLTENRLFTLSEGSVNILESLQEPVTLDFYFSRQATVDFPQILNYANRVRDLLEEYEARSGGMLELNVIEPEPFSEAEDRAVANGLQGIPVNQAGDLGYFGLVGSNSTDDRDVIPFFQASKAASLEYDITKLIYNLANPEKRTVGVISSLPLFGEMTPQARMSPRPRPTPPWKIIDTMREFFEVRELQPDIEYINDVDVLMVVHPKDLSENTRYAIDQYLLDGGKAIFFVDPLAEQDAVQPNPQQGTMPDVDSDLENLFNAWGIAMLDQQVAGDIEAGMRVQSRSERGMREVVYPPWLKLTGSNLNREDFTTSELQLIHMATPGILEQQGEDGAEFTPLMHTGSQSMAIERDMIMFQRDPAAILDAFEPSGEQQILAARLSGEVPSAFPDGAPGSDADPERPVSEGHIESGMLNAIVIADSDMLADMFWIRSQSFFGINIPQTIADNGNFVINAVENLSGNTDLISLRSRGEYQRPFEVVEQIRRDAERQFREREQELQARLEETEQKILELQQEGSGTAILTPEQSREIERFREEQVRTRQELRAVQHELQKDIEGLGNLLRFINIALVPLLIALAAVVAGFIRQRRHV